MKWRNFYYKWIKHREKAEREIDEKYAKKLGFKNWREFYRWYVWEGCDTEIGDEYHKETEKILDMYMEICRWVARVRRKDILNKIKEIENKYKNREFITKLYELKTFYSK